MDLIERLKFYAQENLAKYSNNLRTLEDKFNQEIKELSDEKQRKINGLYREILLNQKYLTKAIKSKLLADLINDLIMDDERFVGSLRIFFEGRGKKYFKDIFYEQKNNQQKGTE
jgi:hypothetical protein